MHPWLLPLFRRGATMLRTHLNPNGEGRSNERSIKLAGNTGLEPATFCLTGNRSNHLSQFPILVSVEGVEPSRYHYHWILSPTCLPIPPYRHGEGYTKRPRIKLMLIAVITISTLCITLYHISDLIASVLRK